MRDFDAPPVEFEDGSVLVVGPNGYVQEVPRVLAAQVANTAMLDRNVEPIPEHEDWRESPGEM